MFINGIEYNIRFYVDDEETEEEITEELFTDLYQMNDFLEKTWCLPEYENAKAEYVFVEVVNGKPDEAGRCVFSLPVYMPMEDEEIKDVIYEMEVVDPKEQEELRKITQKNQMFIPSSVNGVPGDASKELPLRITT